MLKFMITDIFSDEIIMSDIQEIVCLGKRPWDEWKSDHLGMITEQVKDACKLRGFWDISFDVCSLHKISEVMNSGFYRRRNWFQENLCLI